MQCAPKLVYPSQDQPVRMVVSRWLTSVQDYPWASAWLISPDHAQASALQPMDTHPSVWKRKACHLFRWPITTHRGWSSPIFNMEFILTLKPSQSYLSEECWSDSLTSCLERLDRCCPPTTWLSGLRKDLPTYKVNRFTISEKDGWSFTT